MTSQSPTEGDPESVPEEYEQAWSSLREMIASQGISWSGRESNHVFLNNQAGAFVDVSALSHADFLDDGRGVITLDWDEDGRLDLLLRARTAPRLRLMLNQATAGQSVSLRLRGTQCNRDAIGAQVFVRAGELQLRQTVQAGDSFLSQSTKTLHFGLAEQDQVDEVTVRWPDGSEDRWTELQAGRAYELVQGGEARTVPRRPNRALAQLEASPAGRIGQPVVRIPLVEKIPLPELPIPSYTNVSRRLKDLGPGPVLVNLWGVDCANCIKEFASFQRRADQLASRGVRVVPLNTDPAEMQDRAREMLARFELTERAGVINEEFMLTLEAVLLEILGVPTGSPLPTSLLFDAHGQLCVVYQGKVTVAEVLRDAAIVRTLDPQDSSAHALMFGERLQKRYRNWRLLARILRSHEMQDQAAVLEALADKLGQ